MLMVVFIRIRCLLVLIMIVIVVMVLPMKVAMVEMSFGQSTGKERGGGEGSDDVKDELDLHKHMVAMVGVVMVAITHMVEMVFILKGRSLEWQRVERHEGAD